MTTEHASNKHQRCLVLGGHGFIGSHLVDALLVKGYFVRCFDRPNIKPVGHLNLPNPSFELFEGDVSSEADVQQALTGCDICFHLAYSTLPKSSNSDTIFDVETNVLSTLRLLNAAVKSGLKKLIFVSSGGTVYGTPTQIPISETHPTNPICSYGITKLAIEKYLYLFNHLHQLDYAVLRLANPYGERQRIEGSQGAIAVFLGKVLRNEPIEIWGDGSIIRDYVYIKDVIDALLLTIDYYGEEKIFNIGSGCGYSINQILSLIEKITGKKSEQKYLEKRIFDVPASVLSIEKAKKILKWHPKTSLEVGLDKTAYWITHHI